MESKNLLPPLDTYWYIRGARLPEDGQLMTAPPTKDVYDDPHDDALTADPYPLVRRVHQRCTTTIEKEAVS
jgi:hypothetical protein